MSLRVLEIGPSVLVEDRGRPGWAHLGVPRAGALDGPAADLANRLVGNPPDAAGLEVLLGGLSVLAETSLWAAVTGARAPVLVDGRPQPFEAAFRVPSGATLRVERPREGLRSYLAVGGGVDVEPVLGSRSTDTLSGLGPSPVRVGDLLPVGTAPRRPAPLDTPPARRPGPLRVARGPRADRVAGDVLDLLAGASYTVGTDSDRIGLRLDGDPLPLTHSEELPSEGLVVGAVQVPPDGRPVVFLADHPTTGGYPVVAVVDPADLWRCAQLRPGEAVSFTARTRS